MARAFLTIGLVLALGGCANTPAMRTLATQTSSRVAAQEATMNNFIAAEKQLNQGNLGTLKDLGAQAQAQQTQTDLILETWTLAGSQDLLAAHAAVNKTQGADIVASLAVVSAAPPALDDGGAGGSLEKANSAFTALAKKPGFLDMAGEIFASGGAVYQAAQKLEQAAPKQASPPAKVAAPTLTKPPTAPAPST